jgi:sphingolipid delta-4 desaturase
MSSQVVVGVGSAPLISHPSEDFIWSLKDEPHASRRAAILKAHPEIRSLFGFEWRTKYIVTALIALQIGSAIYMSDKVGTLQFWLLAYFVGATTSQALFLAIHEISHFLAFRTFWYNKLFNIFINFPLVAPYATAFRGYHIEHHKFQGVHVMDLDVPTELEAKVFTSRTGKLLFLMCQILFYAGRPMALRAQEFTVWHAINWVAQVAFDVTLWYFFGWGAMSYLIASVLIAMSLHPCAGHFIAEHYVFVEGFETYSYYGILNLFCFNVGYHNEHHDFPNISWLNLPKLKAIAPEFYDVLPQHTSWVWVMWEFVMNPNISLRNRVKRKNTSDVASDSDNKED